MLKLFIISLVVTNVFGNCSAQKTIKRDLNPDTVQAFMLVVKIIPTDSFYLIYAKYDDKLLRIISKKTFEIEDQILIEVNKTYFLKLVDYYDHQESTNPLTGFNSSRPCFFLSDQTPICSETDVYGPYKSLNLRDLYYQKLPPPFK